MTTEETKTEDPADRGPLKTLEQLKQDIAIAATTGDDNAFNALIKEYNSRKGEVAKQLAQAAAKEAEALAGDREKLAVEIHNGIMLLAYYSTKPDKVKQGTGLLADLGDKLIAMKASGFTFKLDTPEVTYKSVALAVPVIKVSKGGGTHGSSKGEYGMSLQEIYDKFATDEDKVKMAAAEGNSAQWQVKNAVKKAALAAGTLKPAK